jgi:hypothetical protein
MRLMIVGVILTMAAQQATAQDIPWVYKTTIYGWLPGMTTAVDTRSGAIELDSSASDALSNIDMVFMGTFAAQKGNWGFAGDLLYLDLSDETQTPLGLLYDEAGLAVKATAVSGYALYRLTSDPSVTFDVGAGVRAFSLDVDLDVSSGILPGFSQSLGDSWVDPLVAARLSVPLNEEWAINGFADWGGTGGGDETWQVFGAVSYAFRDNWSTQVGYRHMEISREVGGRDISIDLGGPVVSATFAF